MNKPALLTLSLNRFPPDQRRALAGLLSVLLGGWYRVALAAGSSHRRVLCRHCSLEGIFYQSDVTEAGGMDAMAGLVLGDRDHDADCPYAHAKDLYDLMTGEAARAILEPETPPTPRRRATDE